MAGFKVKVPTRAELNKVITQRSKEIVDRAFRFTSAAEVESKVGVPFIKEMVSTIQRGLSPIKGWGRFDRYKNPDKYPGKRKPQRPVNLTLSGRFLKDLGASASRNNTSHTLKIKQTSAYAKQIEEANREGRVINRPIIPMDSEDVTAPLRRFVRELYIALIKAKLKVK